MPGYLRQATASQSRALGPFIDSSDFLTAKTGLTIANTDIKLVVNGGASANKNSGGGTHRVNGVYGVTFDATDTATVGEIEVSVAVSGALMVFDRFVVLEEAVYDELFAASALGYVDSATVNVTKVSGTSQTAKDLGAINVTNLNTLSGHDPGATLGTGTSTLTQSQVTGGAYALNSSSFSFSGGTISQISSGVWDLATSGHTTSGTFGAAMAAAGAAGDPWSTSLPASYGAGTAGFYVGTYLNSSVAAVKNDTALINAKTTNLPSDPADASDIAALFGAIPTASQNAAGLLDLASAIETGLTMRGAMRLIVAANAGKVSGAETTSVIIRNAVADSKARITATVDSNGNRTVVTTDAT